MTGQHKFSDPTRTEARYTTPKKFRKVERLPVPRHIITDHALVRYFERVLGLDVEAIREGILTDAQKVKAKALKNCELAIAPGVTARVRDGRVVTIYD